MYIPIINLIAFGAIVLSFVVMVFHSLFYNPEDTIEVFGIGVLVIMITSLVLIAIYV